MISRRPGGRRKIINDFPPAGEAGGKIQNFQNYYCYNNNNSRPLGRPFFNIIINTTNDLNDFPPAGEAGGKNPKLPKIITYCLNNNYSRPLGPPIFNTIINTTNEFKP